MIPTKEQCLAMIEEYGVYENIRRHIFQVTRVAVFLGKRMKERGIKIDLKLLEAGALLHDLDKHITIEMGREDLHGDEGMRILSERGMDEVVPLVDKHRVSQVRRLESMEEKILWYADMRVNHDKIVNIKERIKYLWERYGNIRNEHGENIENWEPDIYKLEKEILEKAGVSEDLKGLDKTPSSVYRPV